MKKILKSLLALMVFAAGFLNPLKVRAAHYYSVYIKDMSGYQITAFQVYQGDSLLETFHQYPQYLEEINQYDSGRMPTFYKNTSYTPYDPNESVFENKTLYITYSYAINSINLKLTWPLAGQTAVYPDIAIMDQNPKYWIYTMRWLKTYDATVPYTGKFAENQTYWAEINIYPNEMYGLNYYNETLKVSINGYDASYTKNTVPDEGIKIIFKVKTDDKVEAFVRRLYILCLGREPDPTGYSGWSTSLRNRTSKAADIVYGIFNSSEFNKISYSDADFVELCYNAIMDRPSDAAGKKTWTDLLATGVSRNYILKMFLASQEFKDLCKKYGIDPGTIKLTEPRDQKPGLTAFIARLYTRALGRGFDVAGLNFWCQQILTGKMTPKEAAMSFFHSQEFYSRKLNNSDFVTVLYRTFMDREPDPAGKAFWVNYLNNGASRDFVISGFADSAEFKALMKSYGL